MLTASIQAPYPQGNEPTPCGTAGSYTCQKHLPDWNHLCILAPPANAAAPIVTLIFSFLGTLRSCSQTRAAYQLGILAPSLHDERVSMVSKRGPGTQIAHYFAR